MEAKSIFTKTDMSKSKKPQIQGLAIDRGTVNRPEGMPQYDRRQKQRVLLRVPEIAIMASMGMDGIFGRSDISAITNDSVTAATAPSKKLYKMSYPKC